MSTLKRMFEADIVTLGEGQVGKTSIIIRYIDNKFSPNYLATIGIDSKVKKMTLPNGEEIKVKMFDTAGQERFKSITANYIKKANGILFVYDITEESSFNNIQNWYKNLAENSNNKLPVVLIGNKSDLEDERVISKEEGKNLAKSFGIENHFYETSCQSGQNIEEWINDLVLQIYEKFGNKNQNINIEIKKDNIDKKKNLKNVDDFYKDN